MTVDNNITHAGPGYRGNDEDAAQNAFAEMLARAAREKQAEIDAQREAAKGKGK